jgi:hypothetical protein
VVFFKKKIEDMILKCTKRASIILAHYQKQGRPVPKRASKFVESAFKAEKAVADAIAEARLFLPKR